MSEEEERYKCLKMRPKILRALTQTERIWVREDHERDAWGENYTQLQVTELRNLLDIDVERGV